MKKELPEVPFNKQVPLDIEVMSFEELQVKLTQSNSHNPFAPHKIEFYLILIVTKGTYSHFVDFQFYNLKRGSVLFIAKNQVHHFGKGLKKANGFCIIFNHLFVDKHYFLTDNLRLNRLFNYHIESPILHQKERREDGLIELISTLYKEYIVKNDFAKSEILASLLRIVLLKAERAKDLCAVTDVKKYWLEIFSAFRSMLQKEYTNTRSSRAYAHKLLVSYKFLNDVVKKLTGKTVKAFIDDFVIIEIKRYLISTALSVKEISYKTGFEEPANMVKFFKKNTGITPLKFRQRQ